MRRREFLFALGGGAAAWPLMARAQQGERAARRMGVLSATAENDPETLVRFRAFRQGLQELGWTEGSNLLIEYRWGAGDINRMRTQVAELVALAPDLILAQGTPVVAALKRATTTIPIVFVIVNDPVAQGFVPNMARPGGNITGFSNVDYSVIGKSADLLKQLAPAITRIGFMFNPDTYPYYETYLHSLQSAAQQPQLEFAGVRVRAEAEIVQAIGRLGVDGQRSDLCARSVYVRASHPDHRRRLAASGPCGVCGSAIRHLRRADGVWPGFHRHIPARGPLCGSYPERGRPRQSSGTGSD